MRALGGWFTPAVGSLERLTGAGGYSTVAGGAGGLSAGVQRARGWRRLRPRYQGLGNWCQGLVPGFGQGTGFDQGLDLAA